MALRKIVNWRFEGKHERDGQHRTYARAYALFDDDTERRFDVNDVVLCRLKEDDKEEEEADDEVPSPKVKGAQVIDVDSVAKDEDLKEVDVIAKQDADGDAQEEDAEEDADGEELPWVAQIVNFYYDPTRSAPAEKKRVELRWFYYAEHMEDGTKVARRAAMPPPSTDAGITEVAYSEHIDYKENACSVIVGKAFMYHTAEKAEEAAALEADDDSDFVKGDERMVCRTFYLYTTGKRGKGPLLRRLYTGELGYLLNNAGPHDMWDRFLAAGSARTRYERLEQGKEAHKESPDARVAKRRRVERGDFAKDMKQVEADKEAPVDHNAVKPLTITQIIQDRDLKVYHMPVGAELD